MLQPDQCILVCIMSPGQLPDSAAIEGLELLLSAGSMISLPLVFATYDATLPLTELKQRAIPAQAISARFDPLVANWEASSLAVAVANTKRRKVILCGCWLEEAVTLLALQLLRTGIDVYLCVDAIDAIRSDQIDTHYSRLKQYNAMVTTIGQVLREWSALCGSADGRTALQPLIERLTNHSS